MADLFLTKSRHGSIYYFRRRVPQAAQKHIGRRVLVQSLETRLPREWGAVVTHVNAEPHEEEAVNSAIRTALAGKRGHGSMNSTPTAQKPFSEAIPEYFSKSQTKAQTKATYRSKLGHAKKFFGDSKCVLEIDQADFVGYCDHVSATVPNTTSQGHYMTTVATFLNWFRVREAGLPALSTNTLVPKRDSPESDDRDAFTLEQLGMVFENAKQYRLSNPAQVLGLDCPCVPRLSYRGALPSSFEN